ncbi:uncharacterized protein LOC131318108 [Rhododendron vialii]|uniref:uncharacterized protein LOC131318108 n=1 Tax=Rhododendron vialii TaxID=182163 RepID=UPI00265EEB98|nr:uncharacterized protein LOC131318108 [Rhododendron vialii]
MAIETLWNTADISTVVWSSKDELMHVTAHDIQTLLFESALSTRSVDAYMNILMQQHVDQQPTFILETQPAKSFVFPSFFVSILNDKQPIKVKKILDTTMPKAVYATFLLFPIIHQFHWTLLVLHKNEGKWIFYNSLFKGHRKDFYYESTNNLRKLIADYINSHSKSSAGKGIGDTVHIEQFSPQQLDGFVECGVVIIFLMKQYLRNQERSKVISIEECRKVRAEMITAFLSDQSKSSTSKVPQPVQNLKQIAESSKALKPQFKHSQLRVKQGPKIK